MPKNDDRIQWVDGLKGLLVIWIMLFHYAIAFINKGYVGFGTNYAEGELFERYFEYFPFSTFVNSSFPLYVFLFLIAFIPAYQFFGDGSEARIVGQAKVRYFRLMIPTFTACLITFILHHAGLLRHVSAGEQTGIVFLGEIMKVDFSFPSLLYEGLIKAYVSGSQYIAVSWVLGYIFIGSFLSYAVLMLFGKNEKRIPFYIGLFVFLFFFDQSYICFLAGIVVADLLRRSQDGKMRALPPVVSVILIVAGLLLAAFPLVWLPKWLDAATLYGIGAALFVTGIAGCRTVQRVLETKPLQTMGRYSFSAILIHMPLLSAVSCLQYMLMLKAGISNTVTVLAVFLVAIPVQILAAFLFQKMTVPLTNLVVKKIRSI